MELNEMRARDTAHAMLVALYLVLSCQAKVQLDK